MSATTAAKAFFEKIGPSHEYTPLTFMELDIEKLKKKMRLKEEGLDRGKNNLPQSDATEFDYVELRIISAINDEVKSASETVHDHLESFQTRMQNLFGIGFTSKMEQLALAAEGKFNAEVLSKKAQLFTTKQDVTNVKVRFENFKSKYGLEADAVYPESRFLYLAVVAVLVSLETIFNGSFLGKGNEGGLIGGTFFAFGFSAINATLAFLLGNFALRLAIHPFWPKKLLGTFLTITIPAAMIFMNLILSWLRTAMSEVGDEVIANTIYEIRWHDLILSLKNSESLILFGGGLLCCLIITIDFWKMDDSFPGFGALSRDYKKKIEEYADLKSEALEELEEIQTDSHEKLNETLSSVSSMSQESGAIFDSQNRWRRLYDAHLSHLEDAGKQLLDFYRGANISARNTTTPEHFKAKWQLVRQDLPEPNASFLSATDNIRTEGKNAQQTHIDCVKRVSSAYNKALHEYQTIEQL